MTLHLWSDQLVTRPVPPYSEVAEVHVDCGLYSLGLTVVAPRGSLSPVGLQREVERACERRFGAGRLVRGPGVNNFGYLRPTEG